MQPRQKGTPEHNLYQNFITEREYGRVGRPPAVLRADISSKLPATLVEREFDVSRVMRSDKIFTSCWLDSNKVVTGSKCNKLRIWNASKGVDECSIPLPPSRHPIPADACGIHSVTMCPSHAMLATGSTNPLDIALLDTETFTSQLTLRGHRDWVFALEFLDDSRLVSAGRDGCLMLWSAAPAQPRETERAPLLQRREHSHKVRDVKLFRSQRALVTISADTSMKLWSPDSMDVVGNVALGSQQEMVCLAADDSTSLAAIGTRDGVLLVDVRSLSVVARIGSRDDNGVRSLVFRDHMLSAGTGRGCLMFADVRQQKFIPEAQRTASMGFLERNQIYHAYFDGQDVPQAIYTHCWSPDGSMLFAGGGPLMSGLQGAYAALWS